MLETHISVVQPRYAEIKNFEWLKNTHVIFFNQSLSIISTLLCYNLFMRSGLGFGSCFKNGPVPVSFFVFSIQLMVVNK